MNDNNDDGSNIIDGMYMHVRVRAECMDVSMFRLCLDVGFEYYKVSDIDVREDEVYDRVIHGGDDDESATSGYLA